MRPVRIGFVLLSPARSPIPSTRISVLNLVPFLRAAGFEPSIVFEPEEATETPDLSGLLPRLVAEEYDVVYFQKVHGPTVLNLVSHLADRGVKTVYGVCDLVNVAMAEATDATIVVTDYLKSLYPPHLQARIHVVHDGIERPDVVKTAWRDDAGSPSTPLGAVLVVSSDLRSLPVLGTPPPWLAVDIIGRYPPANDLLQRMRVARWKLAALRTAAERRQFLRFMLDRRIRCHPWDPGSVYARMVQADFGIIPVEATPCSGPDSIPPPWMVKSENRLTMKMAVGLPVIATPIPSYEAVVEQGVNGFLARSRVEWFEFLERRRDPALRRAMGDRARASVLPRYSMEEQARRMVAVLSELVAP